MTERLFCIVRVSTTANHALSRADAAQLLRRAKYRARSMRVLAILRVRSRHRGKGASRADCGRRSRCCSLISSAFSSSTSCDYEDRTVRVTSSSSQPPSKTFASSRNSFRCRSREGLRTDRDDTCRIQRPALVNSRRSFSTESAKSRHSAQRQRLTLFDHLVSGGEQRRRKFYPECL